MTNLPVSELIQAGTTAFYVYIGVGAGLFLITLGVFLYLFKKGQGSERRRYPRL